MFHIPCKFPLIKSKDCQKLKKLINPTLLFILFNPNIIKTSKKPKNLHQKINLKIIKTSLKRILQKPIPYSPLQTTMGLKTHVSENPHINSIKSPPKKMFKNLSKNLMKYHKFRLLKNLSNRKSTIINPIKLNNDQIKNIQNHKIAKNPHIINLHLITILIRSHKTKRHRRNKNLPITKDPIFLKLNIKKEDQPQIKDQTKEWKTYMKPKKNQKRFLTKVNHQRSKKITIIKLKMKVLNLGIKDNTLIENPMINRQYKIGTKINIPTNKIITKERPKDKGSHQNKNFMKNQGQKYIRLQMLKRKGKHLLHQEIYKKEARMSMKIIINWRKRTSAPIQKGAQEIILIRPNLI